MGKESKKIIANNKKAFYDYFIEDKYEAGIELVGTEVKSLRMGKCSIKEAFVRIQKGEVFIYGMHISPYEKGIYLTGILSGQGSFYCTVTRSVRLKGRLLRRDILWCR